MILNISAQKQAIINEMKILGTVRYKLANQLRNFKQFNQLRIITKSINKFIHNIDYVEKYNIKEI